MTTTIRRFVAGNLKTLGARQFGGIAATDAMCLDGIALVMAGGDLTRLQGGVLSWNHSKPYGRILSATKTASTLPFTAEFASAGVNDDIDECCALLKDGVVNYGVSLTFNILASEPIDPQRPDRGKRATKWEAAEIALCLVGVDKGAKVTQRARRTLEASPASMMAALQSVDRALDAHRAAGRHHQALADAADRLSDHRGPLGTALRAYRTAVESGDTETAIECQARCERHLTGMQRELSAISDRHGDAADCHADIARALQAATNGTQLQVSDGIATDTAARSLAVRLRQLDLLRLARPSVSDDHSRRHRETEVLELAAKEYE